MVLIPLLIGIGIVAISVVVVVMAREPKGVGSLQQVRPVTTSPAEEDPPIWAAQMPDGLRPDPSQVARLEEVRRQFGLRHDELGFHLMAHAWTTARVLHHSYGVFHQAYPQMPHDELMGQVLLQRIHAGVLESLLGIKRSSSSSSQAAATAARFGDIDSMAAAIAAEERRSYPHRSAPGFEAAERRISEILSVPPLKGQPLPAAIRGLIADRWREFDQDGRFGSVTESRMRLAISAYEEGSAADDAFSATVFAICNEMTKTWDSAWGASGLPPEKPQMHQESVSSRTEAPSSSPSPAAQSASSSSNYLLRLWRGEIPLAVTFWLYGILPSLGLNIFFTLIVRPNPVVTIVYLAYYVFMIAAIWRSSEKYRGAKIWGALARISVILGGIRTLLAFFGSVG
jgi:hypothetical protein